MNVQQLVPKFLVLLIFKHLHLDLTNEEEIRSLPEKEFRIMIVRMIQNLGNRIDKMQYKTLKN